MRFESAVIEKTSQGIFVMKVNYYYLFFLPYQETYVYDNLQTCKEKLLQIRTRDHLTFITGGQEKNLDLLKFEEK